MAAQRRPALLLLAWLLPGLAAHPLCRAATTDQPHLASAGLVELSTRWNGRVFCAARTTTIQDLTVAVAAFAHAHPELGATLNGEQTLRGLAERYPCDAASLPSRGADARLRRAFADISAPLQSLTPLFSQLLSMSLPAGFQPAAVFESGLAGPRYQREQVLEGESRADWSQRITITVDQGLSASKDLSPQRVVEAAAAGWRQSCPESFVVSSVAVAPVSGFDAFAAIVGCGTSPASQGRDSETTLILVIRGERDYYTIAWAERGMPWSTPMPIDKQFWLERLDRLVPIKLCPIVPGEAPPYLSCVSRP